ncbi:M28 family peptidase [Phenylobacterium sp.]|uniref:M28 family peptidase n=1 Tax=Phenylobacterium sp. TaxID=1871053 RepID=UPI0035B13128
MRTALLAAAAAVLSALPAAAQAPAVPTLPAEPTLLRDLPAQVSTERLRADIARMVAFGTRHTLSDAKSEKRGIGAARRWVAAEFGAIARDCGGCLTIATPSAVVTAPPRVPTPTEIVDVLAIQRGTSDPNRVVIISGHLDSRVTDVMDFKSDAPGANDDASGVAAVIEAARVLSRHRFGATIVYAALSGEEQGLHGGKILADYARQQGWQVVANLNNDIVGNTEGIGGARDNTHVRVFSEGTKATETPEEANRRRYNGGEVDSPSRQVARYLDGLADRYLANLDVVMVYRTDRFSRGGDQVRMLEAGFPAVRITEAVENYNRQHQDLRTEKGIRFGDTIDGVDFPYLAQVTRLNILGLAALAAAPAPPTGVEISGAVSADTTVKWTPAPDAVAYRVWWRGTTDPTWRYSRLVPPTGETKLAGVNIDDWFFGVSAVGRDGHESPVVFPGVPGRWAHEAPKAP